MTIINLTKDSRFTKDDIGTVLFSMADVPSEKWYDFTMEHLHPLSKDYGLLLDEDDIEEFVEMFQGNDNRGDIWDTDDIEYWEKLGVIVFTESLATISKNLCSDDVELWFYDNDYDVQVIKKRR